jgi:hypothetical protein
MRAFLSLSCTSQEECNLEVVGKIEEEFTKS